MITMPCSLPRWLLPAFVLPLILLSTGCPNHAGRAQSSTTLTVLGQSVAEREAAWNENTQAYYELAIEQARLAREARWQAFKYQLEAQTLTAAETKRLELHRLIETELNATLKPTIDRLKPEIERVKAGGAGESATTEASLALQLSTTLGIAESTAEELRVESDAKLAKVIELHLIEIRALTLPEIASPAPGVVTTENSYVKSVQASIESVRQSILTDGDMSPLVEGLFGKKLGAPLAQTLRQKFAEASGVIDQAIIGKTTEFAQKLAQKLAPVSSAKP